MPSAAHLIAVALVAMSAGSIAVFLAGPPFWMTVQRWFMALAVCTATEAKA